MSNEELAELIVDIIRRVSRYEVIEFSNHYTAAPFRQSPDLQKAGDDLKAIIAQERS